MLKTYKAIGSQVTLVVWCHNQSMRIKFSPISNYVAGAGGSEFTTDDPELQNALESNGMFGDVYSIKNSLGDLTTDTESSFEEPKEEVCELEPVSVASLADAKNWLVDNKKWNPQGRVTRKTIVDTAKAYGIEFVGI